MRRVATMLVSLLATTAPLFAACPELASLNTAGMQGNWASMRPSISADGRFVAFESLAKNLGPTDNNVLNDVFVHDMKTGRTVCCSAPQGFTGNGESTDPQISADGRFVVYRSTADNLVANDTNQSPDIFVYSRANAEVTRVSLGNDDLQTRLYADCWDPAISGDGRYVTFVTSDHALVPNNTGNQLLVCRDRQTRTSWEVVRREDNGYLTGGYATPCLSGDGQEVAFVGQASDLVAGDNNGASDIFVDDLAFAGGLRRVSIAAGGGDANGVSLFPSCDEAGGRIAFVSDATNLVTGDTNGVIDVFVWNAVSGQCVRASVASDGTQANARSISPSISANGRFVAFVSYATNLVPGVTRAGNVYVHDLQTGKTKNVLVSYNGALPASGMSSYDPSINRDGKIVAYASEVYNLVPVDSNGNCDVFVYDERGQPDLMLSTQAAGPWTGNNKYNTTGASQTLLEYARPANRITYYIRLQNEGPVADSFTVTGNKGNTHWVVKYFRGATSNTECTTEITGGGLKTASIPAGEARVFRVELYARKTAPHGALVTARIQATSSSNFKDVVKGQGMVQIPAGTALSGLSAAQTAAGAQISFHVAGGAYVEATICNAAGRPVRMLASASRRAEGIQTLTWDRRSDTGQRVPAGLYLVRLQARLASGQQVCAVAPMLLR